jgi:Tol biopolymer transport system component
LLFIQLVQGQQKNLKERIQGDPLDKLPSNIQQFTNFGERPDISPDNKKIVFVARTFGDIMSMDIAKTELRCLTCHLPRANFIRAFHLSNGDFILIGPEIFLNTAQGKKESLLWYMSAKKDAIPVKLGPIVNEGIAVSKHSLKIAYTEKLSDGKITNSKIILAELDLNNGEPQLKNKKIVLEKMSESCSLEAQDFFQDDNKLSFFCYVPNGLFDAQVLDLNTMKSIYISNNPIGFTEPEGVFPGGIYTAVESDKQCEWLGGKRGSSNIDIWKLKMDGNGNDMERLTFFNDYEGVKASNPVIATNGEFMALQAARSSDPPGMGRGILLYWFNRN